MTPDHLLRIASDLAESNIGRSLRADLCRAVSTAYYAMFHCLVRTCADRLAGSGRPRWRRVRQYGRHLDARHWHGLRFRRPGADGRRL